MLNWLIAFDSHEYFIIIITRAHISKLFASDYFFLGYQISNETPKPEIFQIKLKAKKAVNKQKCCWLKILVT